MVDAPGGRACHVGWRRPSRLPRVRRAEAGRHLEQGRPSQAREVQRDILNNEQLQVRKTDRRVEN